ncbi:MULTISPECIES: hypothetical protein [unclassified Dysgonomonas]|uniref:hypothetical protein n=1 Tax=unclassified Dysgonomonas TaxID=2630389 RepID=UPI00247531CE|nr:MULTISPECIES: hypothetical protein [unclassified Dysgonomonas]
MNKIRNAICVALLQLVVKISNYQTKSWEVKTDGCFRTYKQIKFSILHPEPDMIHIEDIAKGLAYKPHFSGFSPQFFSIAEHSLLVERIVAASNPENYYERLEALLHDGSEAYTGDMIKPLKNLLPNFVVIEKRIQAVIYKRFGIFPKGVKQADNVAQDIEAAVFYGKAKYDEIRYLTPDSAYTDFLNKYNYLMYKINEKNQ